jgi:RNA polymerase sigma-70 factor (ECF subfamily)
MSDSGNNPPQNDPATPPSPGASHDEDVVAARAEGPSESFIREMTGCQGRLYAYILTILPNLDAANDVLQETNLIVWRKWQEYAEGTSFHAWVCRIAYYAVLAHRRDSARDRHLFDEELVGQIARAATERTSEGGQVLALRRCLDRLSASQRELIRERYTKQTSIDVIARALGTTAQALASRLYRIRQVLQDCVHRTLAPR